MGCFAWLQDHFHGLFSWLWATFMGRPSRVLFLGLDNSGKTTLKTLLESNRLAVHPPTMTPNVAEVRIGSTRMKLYDIGGSMQPVRRRYRDYFTNLDAIVYLVDASTPDRFDEAKEELHGLLASNDVPILILGNKIDLPTAVLEAELKDALGISGLTTGKHPRGQEVEMARPMEVFMCSAVRRVGYGDGFRWLIQVL